MSRTFNLQLAKADVTLTDEAFNRLTDELLTKAMTLLESDGRIHVSLLLPEEPPETNLYE